MSVSRDELETLSVDVGREDVRLSVALLSEILDEPAEDDDDKLVTSDDTEESSETCELELKSTALCELCDEDRLSVSEALNVDSEVVGVGLGPAS